MRRSLLQLSFVAFSSLLLGACVTETDDANVIIDGELTYDYTDWDAPQITGAVKNVGNTNVFNCSVEFKAYVGKTIVDVATGYPADLGDIGPDESANFDAVFDEIESHDDYDKIVTKIDCLSGSSDY
jgi:hypothetical protein